MQGFPTLVVVGADGVMANSHGGPFSSRDLEAFLNHSLTTLLYQEGIADLVDNDSRGAAKKLEEYSSHQKSFRYTKTSTAAALAILAAREVNDQAAVGRILNYVSEVSAHDWAQTSSEKDFHWPGILYDYFAGKTKADKVLQAAELADKADLSLGVESVANQTNAKCFLGIDYLHSGKSDAGLNLLNWVKDHGDRKQSSYNVALSYLKRSANAATPLEGSSKESSSLLQEAGGLPHSPGSPRPPSETNR